MSNLGDSNTPIEGESFGLPAGAELGEDNGDLVIQDSGGTIILRRDETNAEWQFENTDLTGINSIDAGSANVDDATVANSPTNNDDVVRKTETDAIQNDVDTKADQTHSTQHEDGGADELNVAGLSGDLADQQQPTDHAHDGTADSGGASLNPEATTLQDTQEPTTNGEIRRSGSDVFVHTGGSSRNTTEFLTASQVEKLWTEDANSPKTVTNTDQGIDYSLANTYDLVLIFVRMDADGIGRPIEVQVNNDTGNNYDRFRTNGSEDIGFSEIEIREVTDGGVGAVSVVMSGRWGADKWTMGQPTPINSAGYYPQAAQNTSVEGPLDSIQIKTSSTSVAELTMEVYGRNIS